MSIEIYPSDFSTRYEITHAISIQMTTHYNAVGKLQLVVPVSDYNITALKTGNILFDTVRGTTYIIINTKCDTTDNRITANGFTTDWLLNKRSVQYQKAKREKERALGIERPKKLKKDKPETKLKKRKWVQPVYKPRICVKCGKEYIPCNSAQKYCTPVCHYPHLAKDSYKEPEPLKGLALDNHLAREQGLTYGQWRGLQILKELKEK